MIRRHTRPRQWSPASHKMMNAASRRLGTRLMATVAAMALLVVGAWASIDMEQRKALVTRLDTVGAERIPLLLEELRPRRNALRSQLMKKRELVELDSKARLAISLVYLPDDSREVNFLVERLHVADAEELKVIRRELKSHQPEAATRRCWGVMQDPTAKNHQRLRAAAALAVLDPLNVAWQVQAHDVAAAMIQETPARQWTDLFRPVSWCLTAPLRTIYKDPKEPLDKRILAGNVLAAFFSTVDADGNDHTDELVELLLDANPQQFRFVFAKLKDLTDPHRAAGASS